MSKPGMDIKIYRLLKQGYKTKENNGFCQGKDFKYPNQWL
jgi:hypothetical protein